MTSPTAMEQLAARAARVLMPNYGERTLAIVRGEGVRCWDADGGEYLDFLGGIAVNNVGHCHPAVVGAIRSQAERLIHCSNAFLIESQVELAERLCSCTGMDRAFFCNSGAEATEAAIKLARLWAAGSKGEGQRTVLCFEGSFHGRTYGAMSATWSKKVRTGFDPLAPGFRFARFNDLASVDDEWDETVCAVLVETIQGEGGIHAAAPGFLEGLRKRCDERGALLICDEIQCGMGRSGRAFAYEHSSVAPDLVPIAKGVGGGLPLGGLLARGDCAATLTKGSHGSTFGGNPVACAAGVAVCDIIFRDDFLASVGQRGCRLWGKLEGLRERFGDLVVEVRGMGLMIGLELNVPCMEVVGLARKRGLLINCTADRVLRFLPPLTISDADLDEMEAKLVLALTDFVNNLSS